MVGYKHMRIYELVLIFKASLSEAQRKKLAETVKSWLKEVKIAKEEDWGQKVLAYPIKKQDSGHYLFLSIEANSGVTSDFEKKLFVQEDILRHLLIRRK